MRGAPPRIYYKMALYLDPLTRETGALRVIPGSHRWGDDYADALESQIRESPENWAAATVGGCSRSTARPGSPKKIYRS